MSRTKSNRSEVIRIRVSPEHRRRIQQAAQEAALDVSAYIRIVTAAAIGEDLVEILRVLGHADRIIDKMETPS